MNRYILVNMLCVLCMYASEEPLDTSSILELRPEHGIVSVSYTKNNGVLIGGHLTVKLHEQGIVYLATQDIPLRVSVLLNRDENNISLVGYNEYHFVPLSPDVNLAIMKEAIDFSINKDVHAFIKKLSKGTALYLSYGLSASEAEKLRVIEKHLEEIDAYERSPIVKLRRLISQEYKGPL